MIAQARLMLRTYAGIEIKELKNNSLQYEFKDLLTQNPPEKPISKTADHQIFALYQYLLNSEDAFKEVAQNSYGKKWLQLFGLRYAKTNAFALIELLHTAKNKDEKDIVQQAIQLANPSFEPMLRLLKNQTIFLKIYKNKLLMDYLESTTETYFNFPELFHSSIYNQLNISKEALEFITLLPKKLRIAILKYQTYQSNNRLQEKLLRGLDFTDIAHTNVLFALSYFEDQFIYLSLTYDFFIQLAKNHSFMAIRLSQHFSNCYWGNEKGFDRLIETLKINPTLVESLLEEEFVKIHFYDIFSKQPGQIEHLKQGYLSSITRDLNIHLQKQINLDEKQWHLNKVFYDLNPVQRILLNRLASLDLFITSTDNAIRKKLTDKTKKETRYFRGLDLVVSSGKKSLGIKTISTLEEANSNKDNVLTAIMPSYQSYFHSMMAGPSGYYANGRVTFGGSTQDFSTTPIIHSEAFGAAFAHQILFCYLNSTQELPDGLFRIVEGGAGNGDLCFNILNYIKKMSQHAQNKDDWKNLYDHLEYNIIELSPSLIERQKQRCMTAFPNKVKIFLGDARSAPAEIKKNSVAFFLSNELVDMFPPYKLILKPNNINTSLVIPCLSSDLLNSYFKHLSVKERFSIQAESNLYENLLKNRLTNEVKETKSQDPRLFYLSEKTFLKLHQIWTQAIKSSDNYVNIFSFKEIEVDSQLFPELKKFCQLHPEFFSTLRCCQDEKEAPLYEGPYGYLNKKKYSRLANTGIMNFQKTIAELLMPKGFVYTIDYGNNNAFCHDYLPRTYFQGQVGHDPFLYPGFEDQTYDVNFTVLVKDGQQHGLKFIFGGEQSQMLAWKSPSCVLSQDKIQAFLNEKNFTLCVQQKTSDKNPYPWKNQFSGSFQEMREIRRRFPNINQFFQPKKQLQLKISTPTPEVKNPN